MATQHIDDFYDDGSDQFGQSFECDYPKCRTTYEAQGSFREVWEEAYRLGWRSFKANNHWQHLCPEHAVK